MAHHPRHPRHPRKRNWYLLVASILLVGTAAVPLAKVLLPPLYRHLSLNKLTSSNPDTRAEGQTYLIRMAERDPQVLAGAFERLDVADDRVFLELVVTLDQIGHWTREEAPLDAWLRWLAIVAGDEDPEERVRVVQLLADLPKQAGDERVVKLFAQYTQDQSAVVRYNALVCLAEMRGSPAADAAAVARYDAMIHQLAADTDAMIARHAAMFLGLLGHVRKDAPPLQSVRDWFVAEAQVWAAAVTGKDSPKEIIALLEADATDSYVRAMAAYALGLSQAESARDALIAFIDRGPRAVTDENQVAFWRAILALPLKPRPQVPEAGAPPAPTDDPAYAALVRFLAKCTREDYENVHIRPLILACLFRDRWLLVDAAIKQSDIVTIADDPVAWLASVEGVPHAVAQGRGPHIKITPPQSAHEQIRLAIVRAMAQPRGEDLLPLLVSEKATVRDQACIIAAERLPRDDVAALVRRLMKPADLKGDPLAPVFRYDDGAKRSAAILAGLTGVETDLLRRMAADFADRAGVIEVIQLALWMQGQPVKAPVAGEIDMKARAPQLLMRSDLPQSTVLLALLHQREPLALEQLLTPRGDQNPKLLPLLDEDRWWPVLDHFLPKESPDLWVWADNELARFQLDLLRNWYVLNRHRLWRGDH